MAGRNRRMAERQRKEAATGETKRRSTQAEKPAMADPMQGDGSRLGAPGAGASGGGRSGRTGRASGSGTGSAGAARGRKSSAGDEAGMRKELRGFVSSHREGWNHDDWSQLLGRLQERGFDTSNSEEIGRRLEQERIAVHLEGVQGVGPARVKKLQEEFGTLWELRNADRDRIAAASGVKPEVADRIRQSLG
jgi:hypothetical protein